MEIKLEALVPDERSWVRKDGGVCLKKTAHPRPSLSRGLCRTALCFSWTGCRLVINTLAA